MTGRRPAVALLAALIGALALPAGAADNRLRLAVRETTTVDVPGAVSAFAVDPSMVDLNAVGGKLTLTGRRAGQTVVTVITADAVQTLVVQVEPAAIGATAAGARAASAAGAAWSGYETATQRFSAGANAQFGDSARHTDVQFLAVHAGGNAAEAAHWALPSASIAWVRPGARLALLDERIEATPLTLGGVVLRGVHVDTTHLALHAGVASSSPLNDLLLPRGGERALGVSARAGGDSLRLVPSLLWLPDSTASHPGVASLGVEHGARDAPVRMKAELGWSGRPGASLDLSVQQPQRQLWLQAAGRPADFAALAVGRPAGSYVDGAWSERLGERATATLTASGSRLGFEGQRPQAASTRFEVRGQASARWSLAAGIGAATYGNTGLATVRRNTASLGANYDMPGFGLGALYRNQRASNAHGPAHGARVTARANGAGWRASLYGDVQQQAPTLELVYQERPDVARAFAELGIVANTPEEVLKQLRDNAGLLAGLGVTTGAFSLAPLRVQAGGELAWQDSGPRRARLALRLTADERRGIAGANRTALASLTGSWRVFGDTDLSLGYARWDNRHGGSGAGNHSLQFTLRTPLTRSMFSALAFGSGRAITGQVLRDDGASQAPLAGIDVVLDGSRRATTGRDGRFEFDAPGRGEHKVEALLPAAPGVYFTSPSSIRLPPGGEARFAISYAAARLAGTVLSDAGLPVAGVALRLAGANPATTVTGSDGVYRFAVPPGEAQVEIVAESLPPGYDPSGLAPQARKLAPDAPATADFRLRAQRALKGVVRGGAVKLTAVELGRTVTLDATGNFVLRSLPAGTLTLVATGPQGELRKVVTVPPEPGTVTGIELAPPAPDGGARPH